MRRSTIPKGKKLILELEPIPESTWGQSLAQILPQSIWDTVRKDVYKEANYQCATCGAINVVVHAHEVWKYDDKRKVQKLVDIRCTCEDCHNINHMGRTIAMAHKGKLPMDYIEQLKNHFCTVNNCSMDDYSHHSIEVNRISLKRSKKKYSIDWGMFEPQKIIERWKVYNRKKVKGNREYS